MKLKTLKDLRYPGQKTVTADSYMIREDIIKEEAIKDIKSIMELEKTPSDKWWEDMTGHRLTYSEEAKQGIINYIKWKNNITEEDLK